MGTLIAFIRAVPTIDKWFQNLAAAYTAATFHTWEKENQNAILALKVDHDQRPAEHAIGSPTAGLPSGDAGSTIVDAPPPNVGLPKP